MRLKLKGLTFFGWNLRLLTTSVYVGTFFTVSFTDLSDHANLLPIPTYHVTYTSRSPTRQETHDPGYETDK